MSADHPVLLAILLPECQAPVGSAFALTPSSKLVIDKSVCNPETEERSSFLELQSLPVCRAVQRFSGRSLRTAAPARHISDSWISSSSLLSRCR